MKILGRIKKSKVLTAVMTAVLIFQSACPTGLAYAAQKSGVSAYAAGQTIDQALGATKTVESVLSQHENDEYYLTTPYGNKGPHGEGGAIDTWDCWKPKGEYGSGAYMNCAGFVVAVLRACGANTSIIGNYTAKDGYNRGNETNASKWDEYCRDNNAVSYTFSSKEQMLASGILEKGDIPKSWKCSPPSATGRITPSTLMPSRLSRGSHPSTTSPTPKPNAIRRPRRCTDEAPRSVAQGLQ